MEETRMQPCSKCLQPVGNDAVLLKNGCYMCPTCYQRAYPTKQASAPPKRIVISVEGVITILVICGLMYGSYLLYSHHVETAKAEALAAKQAEELADKRQREERALAEATRKKLEEDRIAAQAKVEADRKAAAEAARLVAEAAKNEMELKKELLAQQKREAQERRDAELKAEIAAKEQQEYFLKARESAAEGKKRNAEIADLLGTTAELEKNLARAESDRTNKTRTLSIHKNIFETKKATLEGIAKRYNYPLTVEQRKHPIWQHEWQTSDRVTSVGNTKIVQEDEFAKVVQQYNTVAAEVRANLAAGEAEKGEIDKLSEVIADANAKLGEAKRRLNELKGKGAVVAATNAARRPGFKTLYKKDGTTIQVQSTISTDKEMTYKDEDGKWQTINLADIDRIEANPATTVSK